MAKLFLLRHFKSQWNEENRFTGWVDVPILPGQEKKIKKMSKKVFKNRINCVYTSPLFRNQNSAAKILGHYKKYPIFIHLDKGKMKKWGNFKELNKNYIPVYISEKLNERYYGKLQGENKKKIMKKYGKEQVQLWRRGFTNTPPGGENLKQTLKRVSSLYKKRIKQDLISNKNVLVVASHNSLRALVKQIEDISDKDIKKVEISYGSLLEYSTNKKGLPKNKFFDKI